MYQIFSEKRDVTYTGFSGGEYNLLIRSNLQSKFGELSKRGDIQAISWTQDASSNFIVGTLLMAKVEKLGPLPREGLIEIFFWNPEREQRQKYHTLHVIIPPNIKEGELTNFVGCIRD